MHSMYYAYHVAVLLMMVLFRYLDFLRIEDLDLYNLAVKKASSLLLTLGGGY
jgi:hypothetical protein